VAVKHEQANEAGIIRVKIGGGNRGASHDLGGGEPAWLEQGAPTLISSPLWQQMQIGGDEQRPRLWQKAHEA